MMGTKYTNLLPWHTVYQNIDVHRKHNIMIPRTYLSAFVGHVVTNSLDQQSFDAMRTQAAASINR